MSRKRLHTLLAGLQDLGEFVFVAPPSEATDPLMADWRRAAEDATAAYEAWRASGRADAYATYRACADRADAAQDALAARAYDPPAA